MDSGASFKLDISMSKVIKGFAIILMVIHHCFGFPAWYIDGISYNNVVILGVPLWTWIMNPTEICVSLFAFLTGYAYFFNKIPSLKYSIKKILSFLKYYWFILFVIFIPCAVALGTYAPTLKSVIFNMFAVNNNLICFAWYVYFYIFVMLTLPFVTKLFNGRLLFDFFLAVVGCVLLYNLASHVTIPKQYLVSGLLQCLYWYPCVLIGYLFAKHDIFNRLKKHFEHPNKILYVFTILAMMGCRLKWQRLLNVNLDVIYAPVIIFSFVMLVRDRAIIVKNIFGFLGNHAMNIWFLHSIFFTSALSLYFQNIAYLPKNPILVVLWVILLCLPFSIVINFIFWQQEKLFARIRKKPAS